MQTPLHITFRHTDHSKVLEERVRELIQRLEHIFDRITSCHVVIEGPAVHSENGGRFSVRVEVMIPGGTVNAASSPSKNTNAYSAAADAFEAARRQLTAFKAG